MTTVGTCMEKIVKSDIITIEWYQCTHGGSWDIKFNCSCSSSPVSKCSIDDETFKIAFGKIGQAFNNRHFRSKCVVVGNCDLKFHK